MDIKKAVKITGYLIFTVAICVFIFLNSAELSEGIRNGISLCVASVVPSLFPFMLISDFIIKSGISKIIGGILLRPLAAILKLSDEACTVFFMSLIGGYPIGPKMTSELVEENKINESEAKRLLTFSVNPSPAFVITMLGGEFFGSKALGAVFYFSSAVSSLIIALFFSVFKHSEESQRSKIYSLKNPVDSFVNSAASSTMSMLFICAWVIIFNSIISLITFYFHNKASLYFCSFLEITNGVLLIKKDAPLMLCSALISFAGISVHCQVLAYVKKSGLKIKRFIASRLIHACLSAIICSLLLKIFPVKADVFSNYSTFTASSFSVSFPAAAALIAMCMLFILEVDTDKKIC